MSGHPLQGTGVRPVTEQEALRDLVAAEKGMVEVFRKLTDLSAQRAELVEQLAEMRGAIAKKRVGLDQVALMAPAEARELAAMKPWAFWQMCHKNGFVSNLGGKKRGIKRQPFLNWLRTR
jgi:hypothetical protein